VKSYTRCRYRDFKLFIFCLFVSTAQTKILFLKFLSLYIFIPLSFIYYKLCDRWKKKKVANPVACWSVSDINASLNRWTRVRSGWRDNGQIRFFALSLTDTKSRSMKTQNKEGGHYPAILTIQTWLIKDYLYEQRILLYYWKSRAGRMGLFCSLG